MTKVLNDSEEPDGAPALESGPLGASEVHIWQAEVDPCRAFAPQFESTLSQDERARAARFHFARDQMAFVCARGLVRLLLASYLGSEPAALSFTYNQRGKPELGGSGLHFNLSHSHGVLLFAFARARRVGIDVELIQPERALAEIVARHFSECECMEWHRLPTSERTKAFFSAWTQKEAYLKATGDGLGVPLSSFSTSIRPQEPACLHGALGEKWSLHSFSPRPGYAAAVAVEGKNFLVRSRAWRAPSDAFFPAGDPISPHVLN